MMYEIHHDYADRWALCRNDGGELTEVGWFYDRADAARACEALNSTNWTGWLRVFDWALLVIVLGLVIAFLVGLGVYW